MVWGSIVPVGCKKMARWPIMARGHSPVTETSQVTAPPPCAPLQYKRYLSNGDTKKYHAVTLQRLMYRVLAPEVMLLQLDKVFLDHPTVHCTVYTYSVKCIFEPSGRISML